MQNAGCANLVANQQQGAFSSAWAAAEDRRVIEQSRLHNLKRSMEELGVAGGNAEQ